MAGRLESLQEYHFIRENLRTDQEQDYFVGGSYSNPNTFVLFPPSNAGILYKFESYSPRQSGDLFFNIIYFH